MVYLGTAGGSGSGEKPDSGTADKNGDETSTKNGTNGHSDQSEKDQEKRPNSSSLQPGGSSNRASEAESSSNEEEREGRIRVGKEYQAVPPTFIPANQRRPEQCPERALLVWSPNNTLTNGKLDEYIQVSKEKYGYNAEQALGMLFWHKHDLDRALQDLANFTPFPDEWSVEDKVLFEQAFQFHGKSFHRIRQMLPDKTIAQLVKYYYGWKKTRTRTSLMDRQARKLAAAREDAAPGAATSYGEIGSARVGVHGGGGTATATTASTSSTDSKNAIGPGANLNVPVFLDSENEEEEDFEEKDKESTAKDGQVKKRKKEAKPRCFNCGILCHVTHSTPKGQMCGTCHQYYTRTGQVRPTTGPYVRNKDGSKSKSSLYRNNAQKPPKGMYINHDDLVTLATGPAVQGDAILKSMDREIVGYKRTVQNNKQYLSTLHRRNVGRSVDAYRIPEKKAKTDSTEKKAEDKQKAAKEPEESKKDDTPDSPPKINAKWTNDELLLGVQGVRKMGKNFKAISEVIGTKTESHVRSFFVNYRKRYNLDNALKEYENENGLEGGFGGGADQEETEDQKERDENSTEMKKNGKATAESVAA